MHLKIKVHIKQKTQNQDCDKAPPSKTSPGGRWSRGRPRSGMEGRPVWWKEWRLKVDRGAKVEHSKKVTRMESAEQVARVEQA